MLFYFSICSVNFFTSKCWDCEVDDRECVLTLNCGLWWWLGNSGKQHVQWFCNAVWPEHVCANTVSFSRLWAWKFQIFIESLSSSCIRGLIEFKPAQRRDCRSTKSSVDTGDTAASDVWVRYWRLCWSLLCVSDRQTISWWQSPSLSPTHSELCPQCLKCQSAAVLAQALLCSMEFPVCRYVHNLRNSWSVLLLHHR